MDNKVYQLIYRSKALPRLKPEEIVEIIDQANEFNGKMGITGCLVYDRGHFLQLLEGEKDPVDELYRKIEKDSRHSETEVLSTGYTENRIFESWKMGYVALADKSAGEKKELAKNAKNELAKVSTKSDFTSKVYWYNVHSLLTESMYYK